MPLCARSILVTGASRGLGLEFVKQIVRLPTAPEVIVAACRNPAKAEELQKVAQANQNVKVVKLDIEKDEDIETAYQETVSLVGDKGLNLLINNAGINEKSNDGTIGVQDRERMQKHFNVNVTSPIMMVKKFLPLLRQASSAAGSQPMSASRSAIVMISSIMASQNLTRENGYGVSLHYKSSKSALDMATILMSRELKKDSIIVTALHPGWVQTDMGGPNADVTPEESISGCLKVIGELSKDKNGLLLNFQGDVLPY